MSIATTFVRDYGQPVTESTWQEGANAFHRGDAPINPYRHSDPNSNSWYRHVAWQNGFDWAQQRARGLAGKG